MLLLRDTVLVKGKRFREHRYIGDPINAIRIFNESSVDELIVLDIGATAKGTAISVDEVKTFCGECFMPLGVGGGVTTVAQAKALLRAGAEKVVLNTAAQENPTLISELSAEFGSQSVVVSIDYRTPMFSGKDVAYIRCGTKKTGAGPVALAQRAEELGAGELMLTAIDREGCYQGYDLETLQVISECIDMPIMASAGAGKVEHLATAIQAGASAASAGSMFVFHGSREAVLISYPDRKELDAAVAGHAR